MSAGKYKKKKQQQIIRMEATRTMNEGNIQEKKKNNKDISKMKTYHFFRVFEPLFYMIGVLCSVNKLDSPGDESKSNKEGIILLRQSKAFLCLQFLSSELHCALMNYFF